MISLRTIDGRPLVEFQDAAELPSTELLLDFWNKGAIEFCVNVQAEGCLTPSQYAYLARVIREAAMFPYRWVTKTDQSESTHTLEDIVEAVLPSEIFRIRYQVSPRFYWRRGPGFIQIQDERNSSHSIFLLEEQEICLFEKLTNPTRQSSLSADESQVFARFEAVGLVSGINDWVFALPYRKQVWQAGEAQF